MADSDACCICYGEFKDPEHNTDICIIKHESDTCLADSKKRKHYIHRHCSTEWSKRTNGARLCPLDREKIKSLHAIPAHVFCGLQLESYNDYSNLIGKIAFTDSTIKLISNIDAQDANGKTLFYWACQQNKELLVRKLLKAGASPILANKDGFTPLMLVVCKNFENLARLLVKVPTVLDHLNDVDNRGWSAIEHAVSNRHARMVSILLDTCKVSKRIVHVTIDVHRTHILKDTLYGKEILDKLYTYVKITKQ